MRATIERAPRFFACTRACARRFLRPRRGALADFNAILSGCTNGYDSTYLDPVRPRVPGTPRYPYEYATIKRDLFISMTLEIDPSTAIASGKSLYSRNTGSRCRHWKSLIFGEGVTTISNA